MHEPLITLANPGGSAAAPMAAIGTTFCLHEWRGSGPATLHAHHADDEAWHVLEGSLQFRFADREVEVGAGGSVFVPAGVPHTYTAVNARYLIVLTPRLAALIAELQQTADRASHPAVYRNTSLRYWSSGRRHATLVEDFSHPARVRDGWSGPRAGHRRNASLPRGTLLDAGSAHYSSRTTFSATWE